MDILTKKPNLFQTVVQNMNTNYKYTTITGNLSIKDGLKLNSNKFVRA